ncbi:serine/threonine-protein kinase [Nocardia cyriacigeorgica]|uniref:non-specific serine/threonine protein kinase n=1 Tax=Nocardia cyriacigeorgica TaxID=135487 RepID=A0A6P1DA38_9NOCA|nr:serine/threonine-protein kinase [Nocardia cyriacigeorgica]NEW45583.1 protein kinase [Nocardia cyriacigeorgica]
MLANGDVFAGYVIDRELGRGGMGSVYLAKHPRLPRMTALKLLNREMFFDKEVRARFEREADLVARLDHPSIVTVYDRGLEDEQLWISMHYIDGIDAASVDPRRLPPERAVQIIKETADALDYAHGMGVLHRDVKPANILLARATSGRGERVYLTDFGIARLRDDTGHLTQTGTFTATLAYASPEQLTGATLDHRSDQYSLACTLFWLFAGHGPFQATNPAAVIQGHLQSPPPALSSVRPGLPPALDGVLAKAMAKRPDDRFATCSDFAAAAANALNAPSAPAVPIAGPTAQGMPLQGGPGTAMGQMPTQAPYPTANAQFTSGATAPPHGSGTHQQPFASGTHQQPQGSGTHQQPFASGTHQQPHGSGTHQQPFASSPNVPAPPPMSHPNPYAQQSGFNQSPPPMSPVYSGQQGPKKNTGLIVGVCVGLVLLLVVIIGIVVAVAGNDSSSASGSTSSSTTTATSVAAVPATADSISQAFPAMVPASSTGETGYNNAKCWETEPQYAPDAEKGEPDFGNYGWQWRCYGGSDNDDPFYRFYVYDSAADVQSVIDGLPASATKSSDASGGHTYTNYKIDKDGPKMVTVFTGDPERGQFLMYTDGIVGTIDQVLTWWKSAPLTSPN